MPADIVIGDVYIAPLFAAAILSLILASLTTRLMTNRGWNVHFSNAPLVYFSLVVTYTVILGTTLIPT